MFDKVSNAFRREGCALRKFGTLEYNKDNSLKCLSAGGVCPLERSSTNDLPTGSVSNAFRREGCALSTEVL